MNLALSAQVSNDANTLALGALLDNNSFDRAQLMISNQIQYWQPVFDTLLVLDPDTGVQPNLATYWAYSDALTVLSLTLRGDVSFTDGTPLNAEAVRANIEYLRDGSGQNSFMVREVDLPPATTEVAA